MLPLSFGTDPEMFFEEAGKVLPAGVVFDALGLDHTLAYAMGDLYVDGAALELQPMPSNNPTDVVENLRGLLAIGCELAEVYGVALSIVPELEIDLAWCEQDADLAVFGCDPDQSAWGEECRPATIDANKHPWRYAGCHIHVGVNDHSEYFREENRIIIVSKFLDRTVGLAAMVISGNQDTRRRGIYGRPGIYRVQPHGMEYRTPSNTIMVSPEIMEFIFKLTGDVIQLVTDGAQGAMQEVIPDDLIVQTLRSDDLQAAEQLYGVVAQIYSFNSIPKFPDTGWMENWGVGGIPWT